MPVIKYHGGETIQTKNTDLTLLQISLENEIPHTHACGGQARCSTCRVLVLEGLENLSNATQPETKLAKKKGFPDNIRLACQTKVNENANISIKPLVLDNNDAKIAIAEKLNIPLNEQKMVILFSDIRGFTSLSENMLPYDVVHILNRYFLLMGEIIVKHNGYIDKYIGDGMMALFGVHKNKSAEELCFEAVSSGLEMLKELKTLNIYLEKNFNINFSIGIGIHYGEVILGSIGHPKQMQLTVIGDSVNTASRVESACKSYHESLLISESVYRHIQDKIKSVKSYNVKLKGKQGIYKRYAPMVEIHKNKKRAKRK